MGRFRDRMDDDLRIRGYSANTRACYLRCVRHFVRHFMRPPDQLTPEHIRQYQLYLTRDRQVSWPYFNQVVCALRFFFCQVLKKGWAVEQIPYQRTGRKLPEILSPQEVAALFRATPNLKHRALLMTMYAGGLRVAEVTHLRVTDIDSQRMVIRIEEGKGRRDRYVMLSPHLHRVLQEYWRVRRPTTLLFVGVRGVHQRKPARLPGGEASNEVRQYGWQQGLRRVVFLPARPANQGHTLRHQGVVAAGLVADRKEPRNLGGQGSLGRLRAVVRGEQAPPCDPGGAGPLSGADLRCNKDDQGLLERPSHAPNLLGGVAQAARLMASFPEALRGLLAHPLLRGLDLDDPRTTEVRREIIRSKPFLRRLYDDWYRCIAEQVPRDAAPVLEVGSGAGYLEHFVEGLVTSEVFFCSRVKLVADAMQLPFSAASLGAIVMIDVLHHIPDVRRFLQEAVRCLRPDGTIVMIEPWVSTWSRIIWRRLHHEPFLPDSATWSIAASGPLSGANGALPWIVFERDLAVFTKEFPELTLKSVRPMMPFRYLVSGGVSMRTLMPAFSYGIWATLERILEPWSRRLAMFAVIVIGRRGPSDGEPARSPPSGRTRGICGPVARHRTGELSPGHACVARGAGCVRHRRDMPLACPVAYRESAEASTGC